MSSFLKFSPSWPILDIAEWEPAELAVAPEIVRTDPSAARLLSAALMPRLQEFTDPAQAAGYYRRQTQRMRDVKEILDARTAQLRALVQLQRRTANR
jgi:hypothetical protein